MHGIVKGCDVQDSALSLGLQLCRFCVNLQQGSVNVFAELSLLVAFKLVKQRRHDPTRICD